MILSIIIFCYGQDCEDNMLLYDCDGLSFCNNEPEYGFDSKYVKNHNYDKIIGNIKIEFHYT